MNPIQRVAFIGNHLPRRCGIATFTHDLRRAVSKARPDLETGVVAMTNLGHAYDYPSDVYFQIHDETIAEYVLAAEFLSNTRESQWTGEFRRTSEPCRELRGGGPSRQRVGDLLRRSVGHDPQWPRCDDRSLGTTPQHIPAAVQ